jgi:hypothetical protein
MTRSVHNGTCEMCVLRQARWHQRSPVERWLCLECAQADHNTCLVVWSGVLFPIDAEMAKGTGTGVYDIWKLVPAPEPPIVGEIRFARKLVPVPVEPLASMAETWEKVIWTGKEWASTNEMDKETIQTLLDLLNPLHGSLDRQTYDEKVKQNFDAPGDAEYAVNVTSQQERDLTQAVCILESRLRDGRG